MPVKDQELSRISVICSDFQSPLPSEGVQISLCSCIKQRHNGVSFAFIIDSSWIELADKSGGVVIPMEIEDANKLFTKLEASNGVAILINRRRIDTDTHSVG